MNGNPLASWRDASLILLSLEAFVLCLIPLAVMYVANKGVSIVRTKAAFGLRWLADKVYLVERLVGNICARIVAPIVGVNHLAARVSEQGRKFVAFFHTQPR